VYVNFSSLFFSISFLVFPVAIHVLPSFTCFQSRADLRHLGNQYSILALSIHCPELAMQLEKWKNSHTKCMVWSKSLHLCVCVRVCACVRAWLLACTCDNSILVYANMYLLENTRINICQRNELVIFSKVVLFSTVTSYRVDGWYSSFRNRKIFVFTTIFTYLLI
jgi:hypothetical protein